MRRTWLVALAVVGCGDHRATPPDGVVADGDSAIDVPPPVIEPIHFIGRLDRSDPASPRFAWPGTQIVTRWSGSGITIDLDDNGSWFEIVIDGASSRRSTRWRAATPTTSRRTSMPPSTTS